MASGSQHGTVDVALAAEYRALIERVSAGPALNRSPRCCELLSYLFEWSLAHGGAIPTEEQIGIDVFGRNAGYDTGDDTIVRVQISQLRKRLEQHFLGEGAQEPVVIELPKRNYTPVFRPRETAVELPQRAPDAAPETAPTPHRRWRRIALAMCILAAACAGTAAWLAMDNTRLRERLPALRENTPLRNHFWTQMFANRRPTQIVVSDANAMLLGDFLGHPVPLHDYQNTGYAKAMAEAEVADPAKRALITHFGTSYLTAVQDVRVTARIAALTTGLGIPVNVLYARDYRFQPQTGENIILLGHRKANPWVELFEDRMNFRYEWDKAKASARIVNRAPAQGEQAAYEVSWSEQTYAVIAHVPKPAGEGTVLLMEGTDMGAVEAVCNALMQENSLRELYARLGIGQGSTVPYFEALLRTKLLMSVPHRSEIVALRLVRR